MNWLTLLVALAFSPTASPADDKLADGERLSEKKALKNEKVASVNSMGRDGFGRFSAIVI